MKITLPKISCHRCGAIWLYRGTVIVKNSKILCPYCASLNTVVSAEKVEVEEEDANCTLQAPKMPRTIICNAFSTNMLPGIGVTEWNVDFRAWSEPIPTEFESAWGHPASAPLASKALGIEIPVNRTDVKLSEGDVLCLVQYVGPRLPEGATELPTGAYFVVVKVTATVIRPN